MMAERSVLPRREPLRYTALILIAACLHACADNEPTRALPRVAPRIALPIAVTSSPLPCGDETPSIETIDAQGHVHHLAPSARPGTVGMEGTVLLRVDRAVPWSKVESYIRGIRYHAVRFAYRGSGARERYLPCSAIELGMTRCFGRFEFEVLRVRLVLQTDTIGRCGEDRVDLSQPLSAWFAKLHERAAELKVDGLIVELEIASACSWGRVANVFEQVRAAGVSAIHVLVRQECDLDAALSTGGVEFNIYGGDASTAASRQDEFLPWFPWDDADRADDADEDPLEVVDPPPLPD